MATSQQQQLVEVTEASQMWGLLETVSGGQEKSCWSS